jgi:hypothetical protein
VKIAGSVRAAYAEARELRVALKARVDNAIKTRKMDRWHYESRIKTEESFALKLETGRVHRPLLMEDLFACTLVVENHASVAAARALVDELFSVRYRRPSKAGSTHKEPSDFPFDDLRLYVTWRETSAEPRTAFGGLVFELQIKTFLQHAWSIATHDLVYKTDDPSWPRARVAYQVKAMLEHAEVSIAQANSLAQHEIVDLDSGDFKRLRAINALLARHWGAPDLPGERRTLALNVDGLTRCLGIDLARVDAALVTATAAGRGPATRDLSPYGVIVQSLLVHDPAAFDRLETAEGEFRVFLPREIEERSRLVTRARDRVVAP